MILAHFLRSQVTEITRNDYSDRITTDSDNFTGDDSTTAFVLTNTPDSITSVTVDGVNKYPYTDFNIDLDNKTINFLAAPGDTLAIVVNYRKGTTWIWPDMPRDDLSFSSYPRIGVQTLSEVRTQQGLGEDDSYDTVTFQIDCVTQKDLLCTINSETKSGQDVANYLSRQVVDAIKRNWRSNLSGKLFAPEIIRRDNVPFNLVENNFRKIIEVRFSGFDLGE